MTPMGDRTARAAAGAMSILILLFLSAGMVAGASRNADASSLLAGGLVAQAAPAGATLGASSLPPQTPGQSTQPAGPVTHVEVRIADLHQQLHITSAQEPQFKAYADVMRSNARAIEALFQQRTQNTDRSAPARLRWYAQLTAAHAEAISKLVPVFDTLYQDLSNEQKKGRRQSLRATPAAAPRAPRRLKSGLSGQRLTRLLARRDKSDVRPAD